MALFPATRREAAAQGYELYSPGVPCRAGHLTVRNVFDSHCVVCVLLRARARIAADPQKNRNRVKAWNERNPGRNRQRCAAWLEENRERNRQKCQDRYYADVGQTREKKRKSYARHVGAGRASSRAWRMANPEGVRALSAARRAREKGASGRITTAEIREITQTQGGRCIYCERKVKLTIDHIVALSKGNYIFDSPNDPGYISTCQAGNGHVNKEIGDDN